MTIRRLRKSSKSFRQRMTQSRQRQDRQVLLERLEDRRLLAFDLVGVQPADGSLLLEGDVRNEDLRELHFRFDDASPIDPATLSGIQITRSGLDGEFEHATAVSDLNTNGAVVLEFSAALSGPSGEGIRLDFEEADLGVSAPPLIEVLPGRIISVQMNSNPFSRTTAFALRNALNADPEVRELLTTRIARGNAFSSVITGDQSFSPLILAGANAASGSADFGFGQLLDVEFTAVDSGVAGNGIRINFSRVDFGAAGSPLITVNDRVIDVTLNTNDGNETTAQQLVAAINNDPDSSALVRATLNIGQGDANVTLAAQPTVVLGGANDVPVTPGYIGIGDLPSEVIVRFADTLPDDTYRIDVFGGDSPVKTALRNTSGSPYNEGDDTQFTFELDLGARIVSVVPQPTSRDGSGRLVQARDEIHVYFNDDPLDPASATDPKFYQLMRTQETARNTDDEVFTPDTVTYSAEKGLAILKFASDLENLGAGSPGEGTFRLRVGTDEGQPLAPVDVVVGADPGSSFDTATDLTGDFDTGSVLSVVPANAGTGNKFQDGDTLTIRDDAGNEITFEFDNVLGGSPGVGPNHEVIAFNGNFTPIQMAQVITTAIEDAVVNTPTFTVTATRVGTEVFLENDVAIELSLASGGMLKRSQGVVISEQITNVGQPYDLELPGASDEPGHRDDFTHFVGPETHLLFGADSTVGISEISYNFQDVYGFKGGLPLNNAITDKQKELARAIFGIYGSYLGVQFTETPNQGLTIVTGDLAPLGAVSGFGGVLGIAGGGLAIMDHVDFQNPGDDEFGGPWFQTALHEIGHLLGLGHNYELPPGTTMGEEFALLYGRSLAEVEPVFPGDHDITHGRHLHRPESKDIDLYRFEVNENGVFSAETIAERAEATSLLDTSLRLYHEDEEGNRTLLAQNDDYYSNDSFLQLDLSPGVYYLGVSASGNDQYDPTIEDTGFGGTTQGDYDLRMNFRPDADNSLIDADNMDLPGASATSKATALDGDADGTPGGVYNFWFRAAAASDGSGSSDAKTVYVDKMAPAGAADGTMARPFRNIDDALNPNNPNGVKEGDVLRIVGNGGADGDVTTLEDNRSYDIGFSGLNGIELDDGSTFNVPKGVSVQIDANAVFKMRRARIGVGSTTPNVDRSGSSLQVFGVPRLFDAAGNVIVDETEQVVPGNVFFTSLHDSEIGDDNNPDNNPPEVRSGDWGGLDFRSRIDKDDTGRFDYEQVGVFLNHVNNAVFRYGGGNVRVNSVEESIAPIQLTDVRPTISYNTIELSSEAAISANPDSFEETNFHATEFQIPGAYTSDYQRVGPEVHGNTVIDNSINGLFVRINNLAGQTLEQMTVAGRFDDHDIVHVIRENLEIAGTPGGPTTDVLAPQSLLVQLDSLEVNGATPLVEGFSYNYKIVFVDAQGNEGPVSAMTREVEIGVGHDAVRLSQLPRIPNGSDFVARRIYRSEPYIPTGSAYVGPYNLVTQINPNDTVFVDDGTTAGGLLFDPGVKAVARLDARLRVDAGATVKLQSAMIDVQMDAQFIAEGADGRKVIFTSTLDPRYGAGGTFATIDAGGIGGPSEGDWAGIYGDILSDLSIDHSRFAYGGGSTRIGGEFRSFNTLEVRQAEARIANSTFEFNADGTTPGGAAFESRFGRGFNEPATIFVRGSQPVIVDNTIFANDAPAISIDVNAMNGEELADTGRATGGIDLFDGAPGNKGPLISDNRLDQNNINGLVIRGATLTTQSVWDDTDMVHVLQDEVNIPDFHTFGGLILKSQKTESLVIKLEGNDAGFTATGRPLDINDRIGGMLNVVGQPGSPVVMTSLDDCTVGAGFTPDGRPGNDTTSSGACNAVIENPPFADVVVLMDDSGSMFGAQQFSKQLIADLEAAFVAAGVGDGREGVNNYGLVSFGDANDFAREVPLGPNGELFGNPAQYANGIDTLQQSGANEDGYEAIHFALDTYQLRPQAAKFYILVTDEHRETILDPTLNYGNTLTRMRSAGVVLEGILDAQMEDGQGTQALALDAAGTAYLGDGLGGFTTSPGGRFIPPFFQFNTTIQDYGDLSHDTQGIVGDIRTISAGGVDTTSFSNVLSTQIVVQAGAGSKGAPGDWRSIKIDQFAHDRNFDVAPELESDDVLSPGTNFNADNAEYLGELAPHLKASDETLRLGYEVQGQLGDAGDVDVYSFRAASGTEVWFDIDKTTHALDAVIELVDADNNVLARSVNSGDEQRDPGLLFNDPNVLPNNHVNPLQKSQYEGHDRWTTNPRDPGMRVVLHGTPGRQNLYYVRVRSNSDDLSDLAGGLTKGQYQMQIRLQEADEFPGSTVRYADIRYAQTGIEVIGQPTHSPLQGEAAEVIDAFGQDSNDTPNVATPLGNLLNSDRGTLAVSGSIGTDLDPDQFDVDWYRLDLHYDSTQASSATNGVISGDPFHVGLTLDLDYADGLGRVDSNIYVFDSDPATDTPRNLVLVSSDSNIIEDLPAALEGLDADDLSRGSFSSGDPFVGTVMLPAAGNGGNDSGVYYIAIASNSSPLEQLDQYNNANPDNPLLRLEPINSLRRIVEDHIDFSNGSNIADAAIVPDFVNGGSEVPFFLSDLNLFVQTDSGLDNSRISMVNPFTGSLVGHVGTLGFNVEDIAIRPDDGLIYGFSSPERGAINDATTGHYIQIDPRLTTTQNLGVDLGDDGIETYIQDPANPGQSIRANFDQTGVGIHFTALDYGERFNAIDVGSNPDLNGWAFGHRFDGGGQWQENILYSFNEDNGQAVTSPPATNRTDSDNPFDRRYFGAGTQIREHARVDTTVDPFNTARNTLIFPEATVVESNGTTTRLIGDQASTNRVTFGVDTNGDGFAEHQFEFNSGPDVDFAHSPAANLTIRDGDFFRLDGARYEFDTGSVIVVTAIDQQNSPAGNFFNDGDTIQITDNKTNPIDTRIFEFNDLDNPGGDPGGGRILINFRKTDNRATIITSIVNAINTAPNFNVTAQSINERITLFNESSLNPTLVSSGGLAVEGAPGGSGFVIPVEETMSRTEFGSAIVSAFQNFPFEASFDGSRLNFAGATTGDFSFMAANRPGIFVDTGADGNVTPGFIGIPFRAADTPADLAQTVFTTITQQTSLNVQQLRSGITFLDANVDLIDVDSPPLIIGGQATGGQITGMTFLGANKTQMYAVTDRGGLFRIFNYSGTISSFGAADFPPKADFIETGIDLQFAGPGGSAIEFAGLTSIPREYAGELLESGFLADIGQPASYYNDIMIGIDTVGRLYAFNSAGELQPIFVDGRSVVETGLTGVRGLDLAPSYFNLWHASDNREGEPGHGIAAAFDGSRGADLDGDSLYFGYAGPQNGSFVQPQVTNSLDLVGGVQGAVESAPFSLAGYSAQDVPLLYFNYRLETQNSAHLIDTANMQDSFRVYVAGEDNVWHMLATNNSARGGNLADDEYDSEAFLLTTFGTPADVADKYNVNPSVQELYDVGDNNAPDSWRQARINLGEFAGQENLRLRFEVSTGGDFAMGDARFVGQQLRTLPGNRLRDGQQLIITDDSSVNSSTTTFEIDSGITLVAPSPAFINDGDSFEIHGLTFEFDSNNSTSIIGATPVPFSGDQSASDLASTIHQLLLGVDYTITANLLTSEPNNDTLPGVASGLDGGADRFFTSGVIGDNPNLTFNPAVDVDLLEMNFTAGDTINIRANAESIGSGLDAYLRLFDANGAEVTNADDVNGNDPEINFIAPFTGRYFLGISDSANTQYDPQLEGSGNGVTSGAYEIEIVVNNFTGVTPHLSDHRVNLEGAAKVDANGVPTGFIEGSLGAPGATAIPVHSDMSAVEVRDAIAQVLADTYAGGVRQAIKTYDNVVMMLGHNVVDQELGALGVSELGLSNPYDPSQGQNIPNKGDLFGRYTASTFTNGATNLPSFPGVLKARANAIEGVYIDDIIIGFGERGEMVTNGSTNSTFLQNAADGVPVTGNYNLEIRTSELFGFSDPEPVTLIPTRSFDTNDRISQDLQMVAPNGWEIAEGDTFTISDGVDTVVFEYDDAAFSDGVAQGNVPVPYNVADDAVAIANSIIAAINNPATQANLAVSAGPSSGGVSQSAKINLFGETVLIDLDGAGGTISEVNDSFATANDTGINGSGAFRANGEIGDNNGPNDVDLVSFQLDAGDQYEVSLSTNDANFFGVVDIYDATGVLIDTTFSFSGFPALVTAAADGVFYAGVSSFFTVYDPQVEGSATGGFFTGRYTLDVRPVGSSGTSAQVIEFDDFGDENLERDQGQIILQANVIRDTSNFAINVGPGERDVDSAPAAGQLPHAGPVRTTHQVNDDQLVPGVVVQNNVLFRNAAGGIRFAGENNVDGLSPIPFGRIVNNTVYSGNVGIQVADGAAPTLMNNIVANMNTGISVDASSSGTVLAGNLYSANSSHTNTGNLGSNAIDLDAASNQLLFIDPARGLFYLEEDSLAVDSAVDQFSDRPGLISVKTPLGIAVSPILAPEVDAYGQLRTDDPGSPNLSSSGRNVFADRGALDRADFAGPVAILTDPRDNDADGFDLDQALTSVLTTQILDGFSIQLLDGVEPTTPQNGVGINDANISSDQVTVLRDGERLVEGRDYRFSYASTTNTIRLTPVAGIWKPDHTYTIELANSDQSVITAPAGDEVLDGETFTIEDEDGNIVNFEFESGYLAAVAETFTLIAPEAGGGLNGVTDRESFVVNGQTFEFDNNGNVAAGSLPIIFTPLSTQNDIADAMVDAFVDANMGLNSKVLDDGRVHLGATRVSTVDLTNAPSVTSSGAITGGVADAESFTIDDGQEVIIYEFDSGDGLVQTEAVAIDFELSETYEEIADNIAAAITANSAGLAPVHFGEGRIHIGGSRLTVVDMSNSSITLTGQPGVAPSFGIQIPTIAGEPQGFADGQSFEIGDGVNLPVVFEFDSDDDAVPGRQVVPFNADDTADQIANAIVTAISNVGLGLNPQNAGDGFIDLVNSTTAYTFDPQTSPLIQLGQPGVDGAVPVNFIPDESFEASQMAGVIAAAINGSDLEAATATVRDDEVLLTGVVRVEGIVEASVNGIADLAGNVLQANQVSGETSFTITTGVGEDYGDAPSSTPNGGGYAVLQSDDGARHTVDPSFTLGQFIDVDVDGLPSDDADGDDVDSGRNDEDGVIVFTPDGVGGQFANTLLIDEASVIRVEVNGVKATEPGYVDAWIDFNADGVWDASEQVITSAEFTVDGTQDFAISAPIGSVAGDTAMRVRLSRSGGLAPTGAAPDGEVEDHMVTVGNRLWHNGANPGDVTGEGRILANDPLRVINFLSKYYTITGSAVAVELPVNGIYSPPNGDPDVIAANGYQIDISNDGDADIQDALLAIDLFRTAFNNRNGSGEGEGDMRAEGEGAAAMFDLGNSQIVTAASNAPAGGVVRMKPAEYEFELAPAASQEEVYRDDRTSEFEDSLTEIAGDITDANGDEDAHDDFFANF